jgi:hypothetical protein
MTPAEYNSILTKLKMTQADIHRLFQITRNAASWWSMGFRRIGLPYAILLRLLASGKVKRSDIESAIDDERRGSG